MDSRCDLVDVVANDAEPNVLCVLFNDPTQSGLGRLGHHVGFIEDDELEALRKKRPGFGKLLDLLANDVYTAIVGGVELRDK